MDKNDDSAVTARNFDGAVLTGASFRDTLFSGADLTGASFRSSVFSGVSMRGVDLMDTDIQGEVHNLVINGVDVAPLISAELDRRHPELPRFRPTTADGFRQAWDLNETLWTTTLTRARRLRPEQLHESVAQEWSFIQTLRHLAFATESWIGRCLLGIRQPWHPLSLPWDEMRSRPGVPQDRDAQPSLDEALELRLAAMGQMRQVVDGLTDERLTERTEPLEGPGWPDEDASFEVRQCLLIVLNEEWWHRMYAERDLAVLEAQG